MKNYGIVTPKVEILDSLDTKINRDPKKGKNFFDMLASVCEDKNVAKRALLLDYFTNDEKTVSTCYPQSRKLMIDNHIADGAYPDPNTKTQNNTNTNNIDLSKPYILWTPITIGPNDGIISSTINGVKFLNVETEAWPTYSLIQPVQGISYNTKITIQDSDGNDKEISYNGPQWYPASEPLKVLPDDLNLVYEWQKAMGLTSQLDNPESYVNNLYYKDKKSIFSIFQAVSKSGLWWGVESSSFIQKNMPFFLNIKKYSSPEQDEKYPTFILVSFGITNANTTTPTSPASPATNIDRFDLLIKENANPQIIDYNCKTKDKNFTITELNVDLAKNIMLSENIEISFMIIAERLVVIINGLQLVYSRPSIKDTDGGGELNQITIPEGKIRVFGTNISASIYASLMSFTPLAILNYDLPKIKSDFVAVSEQGKPLIDKSVCYLPKAIADNSSTIQTQNNTENQNNINTIFGVDCNTFYDIRETTIKPLPTNVVDKNGSYVYFLRASTFGFKNEDTTIETYLTLFYSGLCTLPPFTGFSYYGICPFLYRLKGIEIPIEEAIKEPVITDITSNVLELSESTTAPDYYHVKKTASVTLYNKNGIFDNLKKYQYGIKISWGWNNSIIPTFLGVITSVTNVESPGEEKITLKCEDFFYILDNIYIVNSPIYDGMIAYYALEDMAKRAGIIYVIKDWQSDTEYFLPAGYTFTEPKYKWPSFTKYSEQMLKVLKLFEAYMYFDENGALHIDKLPGGILGFTSDTSTITTKFTYDPTPPPEGTDPSEIKIVALGEKNITLDFNTVVSQINAATVTREERDRAYFSIDSSAYVNPSTSTSPGNILRFKKIYYYDEGMFGGMLELKNYVNELAQRMFYPVRSINFKTIDSTSIVKPLEYITIDNLPFRITGIERKYSAQDNNFEQTYEAEWLGGQ